MKGGQRIIKYLAIALAIFIIVSIVSAILLSFNIFSDFLGLTKGRYTNELTHTIKSSNKVTKEFESNKITNIKIELAYSMLTIKEGDSLKIETNTNKVESKQNGNNLKIKEKEPSIFETSEERRIIVTLPKGMTFNNIDIEAGAGEIQIEKLLAKNLDLEMRAGRVTIQELQITQKAKIEGGAGKVDINSGKIANLDLNMGIGSFKLASELSGNNKIDAGIGKLEFNLTDGLDNYTIRAEKGVGSIKIGEKEISNNVEYGVGETKIKIDGGIGSIEIK